MRTLWIFMCVGCLLGCSKKKTDTEVTGSDTTGSGSDADLSAFQEVDCLPNKIEVADSSPLTGSSYVTGEWDKMLLGTGYNLMTGQLMRRCVAPTGESDRAVDEKGDPIDNPTGSNFKVVRDENGVCNPIGGQQQYHIKMIEDVESLTRTFEASASAGGRGPAWSAAASASFVKTNKVRKASRFLFIEGWVTLQTRRAQKFDLTADERKSLRSNPGGFRERCGDHFIRSVWYGGQFRALYHFKSKSVEEADKLTLELKAKLSFGNIESSAKFRSEMEKISSHTEIEIFVFQSGGGIQRIGTDPAALLKRLDAFFCNISEQNAAPVKLDLASYATVNVDNVKLQFTANHADVVSNLSHLATNLAAEFEEYSQTADSMRGECADAANEFSRVARKRAAAGIELQQMTTACRGMTAACRACPQLKDPSLPDPAKTACIRCASGAGKGIAESDICRSCKWEWKALSISDAGRGEEPADNVLVNVTCRRMKPGANVEVRTRGTIGIDLTNTEGCEQTCLSNGERARFTLASTDGSVSQEYCNNQSKGTSFPKKKLETATGGWWSSSQVVKADPHGTLSFHTFVYNCGNHTRLGRTIQIENLEFEICEAPYCR